MIFLLLVACGGIDLPILFSLFKGQIPEGSLLCAELALLFAALAAGLGATREKRLGGNK